MIIVVDRCGYIMINLQFDGAMNQLGTGGDSSYNDHENI